jgi:hypothetical protein
MPFMYCDPPSVPAEIRHSRAGGHVGHGWVKLKSGAVLEVNYVGEGPNFPGMMSSFEHSQRGR